MKKKKKQNENKTGQNQIESEKEINGDEEKKQGSFIGKIVSELVTVAGLLTSLFLLSSGMTGYSVANLSPAESSLFGVLLLAVTIISAYFRVRISRKKR